MERLIQDLRHALRSMARRPGFTLAAVLTLGLGIGATTAVFSVVRGVLLRPLPFHQGERLARIYLVPEATSQRISLRPATFLRVREEARCFSGIVAQRFTEMTLETPDAPERVVGIAVSEGWTRTLGLLPALGRGFLPEEERAGESAGAVVVSHGFWERRTGFASDVLDHTLRLNGRSLRVVGVMPAGFEYPYGAELWFPFRVDDDPQGTWGLNVQARLAEGVTLQQARAELGAIAGRLEQELPDLHRNASLTAIPTREVLLGDRTSVILALFGAVGFVLLIACANVANLLLARSVSRQQELAVRAALGAGRGRQVRLLLTESLVLALLGGGLGVALALWSADLLTLLVPPRLGTVAAASTPDGWVLGFAIAVSLATGLLFGAAPALRGTQVDLTAVMGRGSRSSTSLGRTLRALVVAETAIAVVLLTGAGVMLRNFERLADQQLGYPTEGLVSMSVSLDRPDYADAERRRQLVRRAEAELASLPGVTAAGVTTMFPAQGANTFGRALFEDRPRDTEPVLVNYRAVGPGFFQAMGLALQRGRGIVASDRADAEPVVVVNRATVRRYWPDADPIGKRVRFSTQAAGAWMRVVGVVPDVREFYDVEETWYVPYAQAAEGRGAASLVFAVRSAGGATTAQSLRRAIATADPTLPAYDIVTAEELNAERLGQDRFGAGLAAAFAAFGLLLACLGLYGVLSYFVVARRREMAVRIALGAEPRRILGQTLGEGTRLVGGGLALGALLAIALAGRLRAVVSEVDPNDPLVLCAAALLLGLTAIAACYLPARRATRSDPMLALRQD